MRKNIQRKTAYIFMVISLLLSVGFGECAVMAASGTVYTVIVARSYQHPVTGQVEDSGGSANKTTGQGMVEGAVGSAGLLEVTDSGEYYLTFKMSLVDYTSKHSFSVQKRGASGWSTEKVVQTGSGKDNNGKTANLRIKIPSKDSIVRCSMYVEPMGRSVIFYFSPSNMKKGNSSGMKAEIVTTDSKSSSETQSGTQTSVQQTTTTATSSSAASSGEEELNQSQGLSLSTEPETTSKETSSGEAAGTKIVILTVSITVSGLILLATAAGIVYCFRKNWERWGGDKDEYDEIYKED